MYSFWFVTNTATCGLVIWLKNIMTIKCCILTNVPVQFVFQMCNHPKSECELLGERNKHRFRFSYIFLSFVKMITFNSRNHQMYHHKYVRCVFRIICIGSRESWGMHNGKEHIYPHKITTPKKKTYYNCKHLSKNLSELRCWNI